MVVRGHPTFSASLAACSFEQYALLGAKVSFRSPGEPVLYPTYAHSCGTWGWKLDNPLRDAQLHRSLLQTGFSRCTTCARLELNLYECFASQLEEVSLYTAPTCVNLGMQIAAEYFGNFYQTLRKNSPVNRVTEHLDVDISMGIILRRTVGYETLIYLR